ncbi:putative baseplate wedge tail fiber connector [Aeromonas phage P19]|uniref:Baseplate wedge tail fiber connector n=2 Tax=Ceceduovirus aszj TaxID=2843652 RepID=A0A291LDF2_9CAUD|nr:baseplate wedge tail fiber connector [Aeromonas phage AS-szw]QAX97849.1 baseplate wedge tail fiber connector [Aeromonas phage Asswx_1]UKM62891.1 putative baseplate wedge tail fiber connector [Aeromonas phage P19]
MSVQKPKELVDTGVRGQEGTGDTLHDGGLKLNQDINSIWNVFGDYRIGKTSGFGNRVQTLHGTGYYQKHTRAYYAGAEQPSGNPVEFGSMHDLSVIRDGTGDLTITLPQGSGHGGECIEFVNTDGSVGFGAGKEVIIRTSGSGDTIGASGNRLVVNRSNFKLTLWVAEASPAGSKWNYKLESIYGDSATSYSATITGIAVGADRNVVLFSKPQFNAVKHMIFVTQRGVGALQESCETLLMVNNTSTADTKVYSTEYARLRTKTPDKAEENLLFEASYSITGNSVLLTIKNISQSTIDVYIKSIDAIGA